MRMFFEIPRAPSTHRNAEWYGNVVAIQYGIIVDEKYYHNSLIKKMFECEVLWWLERVYLRNSDATDVFSAVWDFRRDYTRNRAGRERLSRRKSVLLYRNNARYGVLWTHRLLSLLWNLWCINLYAYMCLLFVAGFRCRHTVADLSKYTTAHSCPG